jgi:hypothetical protein
MTSYLTAGEITTKMLHKARKSAKRLRAAASCDGCRKRRSKCSGFSPCTRCQGRGRECVFSTSLQFPSMADKPSDFQSVDAAGSGSGKPDSYMAAVGNESSNFFRKTDIACEAFETAAPGMEWTRQSIGSQNVHQPAASWASNSSTSSIFYQATRNGQDFDSSASLCSDPDATIVGSTVHSERTSQEQVSKASSFQGLSSVFGANADFSRFHPYDPATRPPPLALRAAEATSATAELWAAAAAHWAAPAAPSRAAAAMPPCNWHGTKPDAAFTGGSTGGWTLPPLSWIQHAAVSVGGDAGEYGHGGFGW